MNKERFNLWLKALESGKYKQGRYKLRTKKKIFSSFCCLGVLCDIAKKDLKKRWVVDENSSYDCFDGAFCSIPNSVVEWLDVKDIVQSTDLKNEFTFFLDFAGSKEDIRNINDFQSGDGEDFSVIIDVLKSNFPELVDESLQKQKN